MLREPSTYLATRINHDKPLWHWASLFKDIFPNGPRGSDIDRVSWYRGHFLFVEAKTIGAPMSETQSHLLEQISHLKKTHVVLVGLQRALSDSFEPIWTPCCWTWIGSVGWRNPKCATIGGVAEFREMMRGWKRMIDALEDTRMHLTDKHRSGMI